MIHLQTAKSFALDDIRTVRVIDNERSLLIVVNIPFFHYNHILLQQTHFFLECFNEIKFLALAPCPFFRIVRLLIFNSKFRR